MCGRVDNTDLQIFGGEGAFNLITSIKIELKVGGFTSTVMSTYHGGGSEVQSNHSGGGGTMDGFIITEMRMRRNQYMWKIETENIVISDIFPRRHSPLSQREMSTSNHGFQALTSVSW